MMAKPLKKLSREELETEIDEWRFKVKTFYEYAVDMKAQGKRKEHARAVKDHRNAKAKLDARQREWDRRFTAKGYHKARLEMLRRQRGHHFVAREGRGNE